QITHQHAAGVTDASGIDMLVTLHHFLHRVDVSPTLMGKSSFADPRLPRVVSNIGDLIDELRNFLQFAQCGIGEAAFADFEGERWDNTGQVAVTRAFTITINGALNMHGPSVKACQGICDTESYIVVGVDAQFDDQVPSRSCCDCRD